MNMHKILRGRGAKAGFTLLELVLVIALMAPLLALSSKLYVKTTRLHDVQMQSLDRLHAVQSIENAFRETVRASSRVVEEVGPFKSGNAVLVLDGPAALGPGAHTVFHLIGDARHLVKSTFVPVVGGGWEQRDETYALAVKGLRFDATPGQRLVSLSFRVRLDAGERKRWTPESTVVAAVRGTGEARQ